jgi:hypothetical protein
MEWFELNKDNIGTVQMWYRQYLKQHNEQHYSTIKPISFEGYMESHIENCDRCGEITNELFDTVGILNGGVGQVCETCWGDMK